MTDHRIIPGIVHTLILMGAGTGIYPMHEMANTIDRNTFHNPWEKPTMKQLLIATLVIALSGCGGFREKKPAENLKNALTNYEVALRWALYENAVPYHINREGERPTIDIASMETLSIVGVDIKNIIIDTDQTEAMITSEISYYLKDYGIIKKLKLQQIWWRDSESEYWFTESEFPNFELK